MKATAQAHPAPAIVRQLIARFLLEPENDIVDKAYLAAAEIMHAEEESFEDVAFFIQNAAEAYFAESLPEALSNGSLYRRAGGTIQTAIQEPAFALGFALAYRLFTEKGGQ